MEKYYSKSEQEKIIENEQVDNDQNKMQEIIKEIMKMNDWKAKLQSLELEASNSNYRLIAAGPLDKQQPPRYENKYYLQEVDDNNLNKNSIEWNTIGYFVFSKPDDCFTLAYMYRDQNNENPKEYTSKFKSSFKRDCTYDNILPTGTQVYYDTTGKKLHFFNTRCTDEPNKTCLEYANGNHEVQPKRTIDFNMDYNTYVHERLFQKNIRPWFKEDAIEDTPSSAASKNLEPQSVANNYDNYFGTFMIPMVMFVGIFVGKYFYRKFMRKCSTKKKKSL